MRKLLSIVLALGLSLSSMSPGWALPEGYTVQSGEVDFDASKEGSLTISASDRSIINFDSFSIDPNETVRFIQPSDASSVLGRVTGQNPSEIQGSLFANGELVLVNPLGIHFAPEANIQVGSLIASTLDIQNALYLQNQMVFEKKDTIENPPYGILNEARIQVPDGGHIILLGEDVKNKGTLTANLGSVVLGAARKAVISFDDMGLVNFIIKDPVEGGVLTHPLLKTTLLSSPMAGG